MKIQNKLTIFRYSSSAEVQLDNEGKMPCGDKNTAGIFVLSLMILPSGKNLSLRRDFFLFNNDIVYNN